MRCRTIGVHQISRINTINPYLVVRANPSTMSKSILDYTDYMYHKSRFNPLSGSKVMEGVGEGSIYGPPCIIFCYVLTHSCLCELRQLIRTRILTVCVLKILCIRLTTLQQIPSLRLY